LGGVLLKLPAGVFGLTFASEQALDEKRPVLGPQNQGTLLVENRFIK
jgi:hypothetical protein